MSKKEDPLDAILVESLIFPSQRLQIIIKLSIFKMILVLKEVEEDLERM